MHPPERHRLVQQAVAGRRLEGIATGHRREVHEAVHVQAVVDIHHDNITLRLDQVGSAVGNLRTRAHHVCAAVDPNHHRLLRSLVILVEPDIQEEAVLGHLLLDAVRVAQGAISTLSVVLGLEDFVACVHILRRLEAASTHGRLRIGNTQPRRNPVILGAHKSAVHALHGMGLVVVSRDFAVQAIILLYNH